MLKTLLIDDERPALKALEHLLKQFDTIEITGAVTDLDEALLLLKNNAVDLLFLDIDMPKQNGIAFAKAILARHTTIHVVFVTAHNQFAVEAFEVNALDYILKPVSKKRLEKTLERALPKQPVASRLLLRQKQAEFLNQILSGKIENTEQTILQASVLGIDFMQSFSFFFMLPPANVQEPPAKLDTLLTEIPKTAGLLAWKTPQGIGILDFSNAPDKNAELAKAAQLQSLCAAYFPSAPIAIGVAEHGSKAENFIDRYVQARNAAIVGIRVSPRTGIYHFLDSGPLSLLNPYIHTQRVNHLLAGTIGKVLDYDKANGTELFRTMEAIILHNNLQDVATALFIHYKTVLFRKQSIEKILGMEMNSFAGRTLLGVALTLYYLQEHSPDSSLVK